MHPLTIRSPGSCSPYLSQVWGCHGVVSAYCNTRLMLLAYLLRLVATLGSQSALKKVNRKAILDVNVPKACETIIDPEAPMALRLQSNLLYVLR
jgi:N terminus of Rad21 / Rec8 like protein